MPKVSIIIPVYNVEEYLEECLNSVIYQTFQDIEIICINDGSTDNCGKILDNYAQKDNRIIVLHQKNHGLGPARNKGTEQAKGDYIFYLDSDDFIETTTIEKLYKKSSKFDLDICVCGGKTYNIKTNNFEIMNYSINKKYLPDNEVFSSSDVKDYIFHLFIGWVWDKLFKRSLIVNNNLTFPNYKNSEDTSFTYTALILANKISVVDEPLHTYRIGNSNSMSVNRDIDPDAFIKAMDLLKNNLNKRGLYDKYKTGFINHFITFSKWHISTISDNRKEFLYKKIKKYLKQITPDKNSLTFFDNNIEHLYKGFTKCRNYKSYERMLNHKDNLIQNIFSVKNSKTHKIIKIIGFKIKVKRKFSEKEKDSV